MAAPLTSPRVLRHLKNGPPYRSRRAIASLGGLSWGGPRKDRNCPEVAGKMMAWSLTLPSLGALSLGLKFTEQGPTSSCFASLKPALASHFMGYLPALLDQILAGPWGMVVTLKLL